ncbi:MAG TPA: hypothetical protein VJT54_14790 [Verrucomicrobiae bacterium]|nr:hypothetical protein [Verrucomicrobiae bacterium]
MNSFWGNLYDRHKDRRYAAIFLAAFLGFFGLAIPGVILYLQARAFTPSLVDVLPGMGALVIALAALVWRITRRAQAHRNPSGYSPLSRDEWRKARSKLLKEQKVKKS